jgi:hypothetical protein
MLHYLGFFFGGTEQVVTVLAVALVLLALTGIGGLVGSRRRLRSGDVVYGWAAIVAVYTVVGVFTSVPFTMIALLLGGLGGAALFHVRLRDGTMLPPGFLRTVVLALPLILIAAAMRASQWDEFSHWLPSLRFLLDTDAFPDRLHPVTGASFPAYPYGWVLLPYFASRIAGHLLEAAGPLLNVGLLLISALLIADVVRQDHVERTRVERRAHDRGTDRRSRSGSLPWGLCAIGLLAVSVLNPAFVQKVALTSYADLPTATALGFAVAIGWTALNALAAGRAQLARRRAWDAGLALVVLVSLKQATLVLAVLVVILIVVTGLCDPAIRKRRLAGLLAPLILPFVIVYAIWRFHVATELSGAEFVVRPFADWSVSLIPRIVAAMAVALAKKGGFLALMLVATGFGAVALVRCRTPLDRLALIVGGLFVGYNGFLLFAYVAAFGANDAERVASLWRYNLHLGFAGVVFAAYGLAQLWHRWPGHTLYRGWLARFAVALVLLAPIALAPKLRFDQEPDKPHFRAVAGVLSPLLPRGTVLAVVDPAGSGESAIITRFQLGPRVSDVLKFSAFDDTRADTIRGLIADRHAGAVLVHSVTPAVNEALGTQLVDGVSYLLLPDGQGGWRIVASWPKPER